MTHEFPAGKIKELTLTPVHRRSLIQGTAAAGALAVGAATAGKVSAVATPPATGRGMLPQSEQATPEALAAYEPVALTAKELDTLKLVIDRLIPSDDLGPGAVEAGVFVFIDRALAGAEAAALPMYQEGLAAIAAAGGEDGFASLAADAQDELLVQAEQHGLEAAPEGFFGLLLEHTRQGMFGDPIWGGNVNFAGWNLIGYPGVKLLWLPEEQEIDAEVEFANVSVDEFGGSPDLYEGAGS